MNRVTIISCALLGGCTILDCTLAQAIEQKNEASVELRNFYFNRDFRQHDALQDKAEEWAQGFVFRAQTDYTEGAIGMGLDALGLLGVKLDSSPDRTGTGLLQSDREAPHRAQNEYSELGLTAKLRASRSSLKVGTLLPKFALVQYNDSRLLPQTFRGAWLNIGELEPLSLDIGRFDRTNLRNSSDNEAMSVFNGGSRNILLGTTKTSNQFDFLSANYKWSPQFSTAYSAGRLDGIYRQHALTLNHQLPLAPGQSLKSDVRWARSLADGGSNIDNTAISAMFTYTFGGHALGLGYQRMSGETGFANINGTDAFLVNLVQISDFGNQDERSWQARYDYNFAALGVPGLSFMTRYISGDSIERGAGKPDAQEWERDTDLTYVVQSGPFKDLALRWRNATLRSSHSGSDIDENRLILSYTLRIW